MISKRHFLQGTATLTAAALVPLSGARADDLALVWAEQTNQDATYDPRVTQSRHEQQVVAQVFDQLIAADQDGHLSPALAKSWTLASDRRSVTLELRDGIKFHDGTPFNADAVKFTFDTIIDPATASQSAIDIIGPYEGADVLGPLSIRLRYKRPFAGILDSLTDVRASIVSPTAVAKMGNTAFSQAPVGTGPFRFTTWTRGKEVVLDRNPDYSLTPSAGRVTKIVHRFIPSDSTRVAALESGEVAAIESAPLLDTKRLGDSSKFATMIGTPAGVPFGFFLNTSRGPFQDIRVRKAFFMAVNRPSLVSGLFFGLVKPAFGPLSPKTRDYWPGVEGYYKFDRTAAGKLLDDAGWKTGSNGIRVKDGQPLHVYLPTLLEPDTAVAVQADVKRIGFDLQVENVLKQKQDELIFANGYDMLSLRFNGNDASTLEVPFTTRNIPEPGKFRFNWARYSDPALDKLLENASVEGDESRRKQLYADAQKTIMEAAIFLPIHDPIQTVVYSKTLQGFAFARGDFQVRLADVRPT